MSKVLYIFQPHSIVDIITNSSSELFVFKGKSKETIENAIEEIYPDYLREYEPLVYIMDASIDDIENFLYYHCSPNHWPAERHEYPLIGDYTFDELYEVDEEFNLGNRVSYRLKDNTRPPSFKKIKKYTDFQKELDPYEEEDWDGETQNHIWHHRRFVTEENRMEVINRIDPKHQMYFMYSRDENPNWECQEMLTEIGGKRYHLG